jgi:hypothetical protein
MCARFFFLSLMLDLICGFGFTVSMTYIIIGLTNIMAYCWHLPDRVVDNCIGRRPKVAPITLVCHTPDNHVLYHLGGTDSSSCQVSPFPQVSRKSSIPVMHPSVLSKSARRHDLLYAWLMLFMTASIQCQTVLVLILYWM